MENPFNGKANKTGIFMSTLIACSVGNFYFYWDFL